MAMNVMEVMHFGKYKGMVIGKIMLEDAGYLCWLREEKKRADSRDLTFDHQTNALLDVEIDKSKTLGRKYKRWSLPPPASLEELTEQSKEKLAVIFTEVRQKAALAEVVKTEHELAYADSWGAW